MRRRWRRRQGPRRNTHTFVRIARRRHNTKSRRRGRHRTRRTRRDRSTPLRTHYLALRSAPPGSGTTNGHHRPRHNRCPNGSTIGRRPSFFRCSTSVSTSLRRQIHQTVGRANTIQFRMNVHHSTVSRRNRARLHRFPNRRPVPVKLPVVYPTRRFRTARASRRVSTSLVRAGPRNGRRHKGNRNLSPQYATGNRHTSRHRRTRHRHQTIMLVKRILRRGQIMPGPRRRRTVTRHQYSGMIRHRTNRHPNRHRYHRRRQWQRSIQHHTNRDRPIMRRLHRRPPLPNPAHTNNRQAPIIVSM